MDNYQGTGEVTKQGQHVSTVKYSVQAKPLGGQIEIEKGEKYLSASDRFTLHMQDGLAIDFRIAQVSDEVEGKYYVTVIGGIRNSSQ
jgi:hypothetical protein